MDATLPVPRACWCYCPPHLVVVGVDVVVVDVVVAAKVALHAGAAVEEEVEARVVVLQWGGEAGAGDRELKLEL